MNIHATGLALAALMATQQPKPLTAPLHQAEFPQEPVYVLERLTKLNDLISRPVYVLADKEAQIEAARDGKSPERTKVDISNLLINTESYKIDWAVLSVGGFLGMGSRHVLVPYTSLAWREESDAFALYVTRDQLKLLPEFDSSKAARDGIDFTVRTCAASARSAGFVCPAVSPQPHKPGTGEVSPGAPAQNEEQPVAGSNFVRVRQEYVLSSRLQNSDVYALGEEAGSVDFIAIDPVDGALPFAVISSGGMLGVGEHHMLVPASSLLLCHRPDDKDDDQGFWCIPLSKEALSQAPRYTKPEEGIVDQKAWDVAKSFYREAGAARAKLNKPVVAPSGAGH